MRTKSGSKIITREPSWLGPAIRPGEILLEEFLKRTPAYESAYITLAKIQQSVGRQKEAVAVLERLLRLNPKNAIALELLSQWKKQ